MGHNRRTCRTFLRKLHKREVLGIEETGIEGQLCQCAGDGSNGETDVTLHLAATHLGIDHVIIHRVETQQTGRHRAIQGEGRTIACCRTKWIAISHLIGCLQEEHIISKALCISTKPQAETGGHGYLEMGVAWHEDILILIALLNQFVEEALHLLRNLHQLMAGKEFQINKHLIVAATAGMYLLAHIAKTARQQHFNL